MTVSVINFERGWIKPSHFRMKNGKMQVGFKGITYRILWRNVLIDEESPEKCMVRYANSLFSLTISKSEIEERCLKSRMN